LATETLLSLNGVVAGYGAMMVLHGASFDVAGGRITTVIGPNGAGKSTLFKAVFGLLPLAAGDLQFKGRRIAGLKPRQLLDLGIAYMPQGRNLFPELTVRHNLEIGGTTVRDRDLLRRRMDEVMDRFPILRERAAEQASTLSGGEQKMLEIGRALLLAPELILIDEPSMGLAPKVTAHLFATLIELRRAGVTVLMVEQNARSALAVSDDGIVLEQGRLALAGSADEILSDGRVGALFLGGGLRRPKLPSP
jgi:branched-chain amino acid transport system ATP-binding protein